MRRTSRLTKLPGVLSLLPALALAAPQTKPKSGSAGEVPAWMEMKAQIENHWKTTYPQEKILNIEKKGGPEFTEEAGNTDSIWDWGWEEDFKGREGSYCRQTALVTVERANKTRARFTVAVLYKRAGNRWSFAELPVGPVEELPGAEAPGIPTNEEAVKVFTEAWAKVRPDFDVKSISVSGKPEFHHSGPRTWLTYKLAVEATRTKKGSAAMSGKKFKCEPPDYSSVLKWDPQNKVWGADEAAIKDFNESSCEAEE